MLIEGCKMEIVDNLFFINFVVFVYIGGGGC